MFKRQSLCIRTISLLSSLGPLIVINILIQFFVPNKVEIECRHGWTDRQTYVIRKSNFKVLDVVSLNEYIKIYVYPQTACVNPEIHQH